MTKEPTPFRAVLGAPLGNSTPSFGLAKAHAERAADYIRLAEAQMADQLDRGAGSVNPPHALRFAEAHAAIATAMATLDAAESAGITLAERR